MACASAYFSAWAPTCNFANGWGAKVPQWSMLPWWGMPGALVYSETLVVRDIPITAVPEPGTWLLMALGLGATGFAGRRRG